MGLVSRSVGASSGDRAIHPMRAKHSGGYVQKITEPFCPNALRLQWTNGGVDRLLGRSAQLTSLFLLLDGN